MHARGGAAAVHRAAAAANAADSGIPNGNGSSNGNNSSSPTMATSHDIQRKQRSIRRKKQLRSGWGLGRFLMDLNGSSSRSTAFRSLTALLTVFMLTMCGMYLLVSRIKNRSSGSGSYSDGSSVENIFHRRQQKQDDTQFTQRLDRWKRVENLWNKRRDTEFNGVAPHALKPDIPLVQHLQEEFDSMRRPSSTDDAADTASSAKWSDSRFSYKSLRKLLLSWLDQENLDVSRNIQLSSPRWIRPYLLPPLPDQMDKPLSWSSADSNSRSERRLGNNRKHHKPSTPSILSIEERANFFRTYRKRDASDMAWRDDYQRLLQEHGGRHQSIPGPAFDYTNPKHYVYPALLHDGPPTDGSYPRLDSLETLMEQWPQDDDFPATADRPQIVETLQHFNYSDPEQLKLATLFRNAELPFKLYGVPDVDAAAIKWTDDYVGAMFGDHSSSVFGGTVTVHDRHGNNGNEDTSSETIPLAKGTAQESRTNYFAFFVAKAWDVSSMGLAPTRNNDWSYATWSQHAVYADAVSLHASQPHFYWQAGVPPEERHAPRTKWCFVSRDLPSLSSATENFFVFHVQEQKGIQCRFGERGVVAATHFDGGRNMVAMVRGAKRYVLSPPNQCSKLGIFTEKRSPIYRHSLLNFGHIPYLNNRTIMNTGMSAQERAWLQRAASSRAVETVLKQGEVLYIPSHWFHYIVSLQKSAQCNVRSGIDQEGTAQFGGRDDVESCLD